MDQLEEIKAKIDIVQFISEFLPLKKAGRNFKALCPFHNEKTPSFIVSPERQIWHCFGCNRGGDIFGFLMEMERMEFGEALRVLAKRAGVTLERYQPTAGEAEKEKLFEINHLTAEFFHYLLLNHKIGKKALNYILQRGITKESLERFKIGYSPPMWDGLQKFLVGKKGYKPVDLEKAGLIISSQKQSPITNNRSLITNYYDRFRDRLMFPLSDHRGNIVGFAGRLLDPEAKEAKYVNTPETLIYHKSELLYPLQITKEDIKKENVAVVVEGELDAISSYQVGIKNVVAIKGSALTEHQSRLLRRFTENLILSLDSDAAGDMAARRGIEIADSLGLNIKVAVLEKYKDPDEAAQKEPDYLREQISKAENIYDFYLNSAFKRFGGRTAEEKKKIGQELIPILAKIEDEIVKDVYTKKLADRLGVNEESIILQMEKIKNKTVFVSRPVEKTISLPSRRNVLEEYYLALIFQTKEVRRLLQEEEKSLFRLPVNLKLIEALAVYLNQEKKFSSQFFFKTLPAELREAFDRLYLIDFDDKT
ncbi:MAG: DNA primase, partial [Microgenomates group bacterium]